MLYASLVTLPSWDSIVATATPYATGIFDTFQDVAIVGLGLVLGGMLLGYIPTTIMWAFNKLLNVFGYETLLTSSDMGENWKRVYRKNRHIQHYDD